MKLWVFGGLALLMLLLSGGCPRADLPYPVFVGENTFGFEPQWKDKKVRYLQVLVARDNSEHPPAIIGPCAQSGDVFKANNERYTTVWAIQAIEPVPALDFKVSPGIVPAGFQQVIPSPTQRFTPIKGQRYFVLACLEPANDHTYSIGKSWQPQ
jgi:hypothetical protein